MTFQLMCPVCLRVCVCGVCVCVCVCVAPVNQMSVSKVKGRAIYLQFNTCYVVDYSLCLINLTF